MDAKEILTRFKDGALDRATAAELLGQRAARVAPPAPEATEPATPAPAAQAPAPAAQAPAPATRAPAPRTPAAPRPAPSGPPEPIAVIGYSARFPGADDADVLWQRLLDGDDLVTEVPEDRWRIAEHYDPDPAAEGKSVSRWGAFVDDVDRFDADFFQLTPREAELTDPQARLFLQEAWRALEHAGLAADSLAGTRCGLYAGVMLNDYQDLIERESAHARLPQVMQGNSNSLLAARLAYQLDLKGPAATVDTACSSSLTALHLACQALWLGEAELMLAGGVTLYLTELPHVFMSRAGMLSPTGRCRPFAADADGIVPGEGCAVVVLKPLSKARADGDPVHAVIRASGLNQDGRTNGITAPSAASQAALIRDTLRRFAVDPAGVDYVECHGTGTPIGDPIEVTALNAAFAGAGRAPGSVPIGSVKGNLGHTSAAAGMAGLLKAIGVVRTGQVPPTLHHERPNPAIPFAEGPFVVAARRHELTPVGGRPRSASVSSFGFSGTNAFVLVEQAPTRDARTHDDHPVLVPLSGRRPDTPARYAAALARWLRGPGARASVADVAHTLACARVHHRHRVALLVDDRAELLASLDLLASGAPDARRSAATDATPAPDPAELLARLRDRPGGGCPPAEDLSGVARLYVRGHDVDWASVSPPDRHRRLSLPGYPFARDRHWVPRRPTRTPADRPSAPADGRPDTPRLTAADLDRLSLYQPAWVAAPLPVAGGPPATPVLVHDPGGELADDLDRAGVGVHRVDGAGTARTVAERVRGADAGAVVLVLHLAGARPGDDAGIGADLAAIEVSHAVLRALRTQRLTVLAVTADPGRADAARAFLATLRQENPRLSGRAVLVPTGGRVAHLLLAELASPAVEFGHLCDVRGAQRRRQVRTPLAVPAAGWTPRADGVYLVTGGAGGIGLVLGRHLARRPGVRVVLCGRTPWADLDRATREAVAGTDRLRYAQADVRDRAAIDDLVRDVLGREGALHGVFHAAGVIRDGYLVRKQPADVAAVLEPKVVGARVLDEATAHLPLDVFVLFSSVAAVTGNLGQSDYAYATGCLDGFAQWRAGRVERGERRGRTLSVQWPLWDVPGMTIPEPVRAVVQEHTGMLPLPVGTGLAILERLLATPGPEVVSLFHGDVARWRTHLEGLRLTAEPATAPVVVARGGDRAALRDRVCAVVADTIGRPVESIGGQTSLEALGLDSVMIRTVASRLTAEVAPVELHMLFGLRDLDELVDHLAGAAAGAPATGPAEPTVGSSATVTSAAAPVGAPASGGDAPADDRFAIIGLSGRYPRADDLDTFWQNLVLGKDTTADLPVDRWADAGGVRARGHFLDGVDAFDPGFFGLSTHEAALIDPQERLFLEVAWEALEAAGYTGARLDDLTTGDGTRRSMGVYVGITSSDYQLLGAERWAHGHRDMPSGHYWSSANRLSYLLDLRGPSQPVDTACSSSLVALHLALAAMRRGECAAALVGGVNLYLHPSRFRMLRQSGFLAEDGLCRSFGAGGAGFGPGEGVGVVLVKPLARALADGDVVHAVVLGSAVAHGGRTNGFTAPSPEAQARLIRQALRSSDTDPATVNVIEAHGTGTELGDPVEVAALEDTYGRGVAAGVPCSLGSVKSAVGHGESAAGIAALTKVVLQLRHRVLAPTLHADPVNPQLRLAQTRFVLQHTTEPWSPLRDGDGRELPRRAGISSFGAGGVNAHVIVEEFLPERYGRAAVAAGRPGPARPELVVLSAPTPEHLTATATRLAQWLRGAGTAADLAAVAHTLRVGRAAFDCRLAVVARDPVELSRALDEYAQGHGGGPARTSDLRDGRRNALSLDDVPETAGFLADLWRNDRLHQVGACWLAGLRVDWPALSGPYAGRLVAAPPTALVRRRSWIADPVTAPAATPVPPVAVEPGRRPDPDPALPDARYVPDPPVAPAGVPADRTAEVVAELSRIVGDLVPDPSAPVDAERSLVELGIDSIGLMNLRFALTERYGRQLALQLLGESSVTLLAAHLSAAPDQRI
ncbi:SDR family NAD(P)-dependent oxidoreductase [Micromonospora sp. NBS 11-29]|uniref:SDR family NAD(P)-dependent oxidoreductase n=1 Tax=Micromonospora sp. NBS 11-29 TaxID=1960879 RepID=UPI000B7704E4|nr:SDR family NAD(P)-dependent oxidoreductase [Micromonospora sp. NBS 11-29]